MSKTLLLPLLLLSPMIQAQEAPAPFCPAGVHADGFLSWASLPPAPQQSPSVSVTQSGIPVKGIPNLTATVTVSTPSQGNPNGPTLQPLYVVSNNGADLTVNTSTETPVTITFSKPVKGVSVTYRTWGRFLYKLSMQGFNVAGEPLDITNPQISMGGWFSPQQTVESTLQIESTSTNLAAVSFSFTGDEFSSFELINMRIDSGNQPDPANSAVPKDGLRAWFRADNIPGDFSSPLFFPGQGVSEWPDSSGNNNNATAVGSQYGAATAISGKNCTPVINFSGKGSLSFPLLIQGWTGMTAIIAAQSYTDGSGSSNAPLYWGPAGWGETFLSDFQSSAWFRFGTVRPGIVLAKNRPVNIGGDFTVTTIEHTPQVDSMWVNGALFNQLGAETTAIATTGHGSIGAGHSGTFFTGNIGQILIYDRALSDTEREKIEQYLLNKYAN